MSLALPPPQKLVRLQNLECRSPAPTDFEKFWLSSYNQLISSPLEFREHTPQESLPDLDNHLISYSLRTHDGEQLWVYASRPTEERAHFPLLITTHGYNGSIEPERVRRLTALGFNVLAFDVRSFGLSRSANARISAWGWVCEGLESKENSIIHQSILDFLQVARLGNRLFPEARQKTYQGFSLAGGLTLMATGLLSLAIENQLPEAETLYPNVLACGAPTFGDWTRRLQYAEAGSAKEVADFLRAFPQQRGRVMNTLAYLDTTCWGSYLDTLPNLPQLQIVGGVGLIDPIVPPETVYPIFNAIPQEYELQEFPCSHTNYHEEAAWARWEKTWIKRGLDVASAEATTIPTHQ
ncbi:MAG: acetylxylan esterase [Polyangiaceae bacterium]|nr:acetylxylan esterase [Polyangiaceae bacterium]